MSINIEIINYLATLAVVTSFVLSYKLLSEKELKISLKNILILLGGTFLLYLNTYQEQILFKTITTFSLYTIIYYLIYKDSFKTVFIFSLSLWVIGMVLDIILPTLFSITGILNSNLTQQEIEIIRWVNSLMMSILIFATVNIKFIKRALKKLPHSVNENDNVIIAAIIILFVFNLINVFNFIDIENFQSNIIALVILVLLCALVIYILYIRNEEYTAKVENKSLNDKIDLYKIIEQDYKALKHNINNHLLTIKSVANEEAKALIDDRIDTYNQGHDLIDKIEAAPEGIKYILYTKLATYVDNILLAVNSDVDKNIVRKMKLKNYNAFSEALGIILDNALEATIETKEKIVEIEIFQIDNNLSIRIRNSFQGTIDTTSLGEKDYSTKNRNSGIGLNTVYNNKLVDSKTKIYNNIFEITISTKLKK